jgi:two-component system sensor histidine kinase KdpD
VDGVLIEELLSNLLENAARYTPPDSKVIVRASASANGVIVEVLDEGPGLERGTEKEIFRRFVRHRPPGDREGTGLGLAICEAKPSSGCMTATSAPKTGPKVALDSGSPFPWFPARRCWTSRRWRLMGHRPRRRRP